MTFDRWLCQSGCKEPKRYLLSYSETNRKSSKTFTSCPKWVTWWLHGVPPATLGLACTPPGIITYLNIQVWQFSLHISVYSKKAKIRCTQSDCPPVETTKPGRIHTDIVNNADTGTLLDSRENHSKNRNWLSSYWKIKNYGFLRFTISSQPRHNLWYSRVRCYFSQPLWALRRCHCERYDDAIVSDTTITGSTIMKSVDGGV